MVAALDGDVAVVLRVKRKRSHSAFEESSSSPHTKRTYSARLKKAAKFGTQLTVWKPRLIRLE